ncbi:peptidoglycan DD-metalloendopeptidase family protein [Flavivirga eckloniae]|uniref:Peptidase M23 n=1 Tax=Flavivirga eckloniae TaxID=1803846 RepID=A0A2K9PMA2_9FLAO|nr:peptidoglycan DD-metalloendopeptidase family protein [Flavivirga eckloniae]AUP78199.1 peptidase M23 [Flavivirga eckloniae]
MASNNFSDFLSSISKEPLQVLDASIPKSKYVLLDLSESNKALHSIDVSSSSKLDTYINNHIKKHNASVAYGGYLEVRNIYKRSLHFNKQANDGRNIHIGIDLWCPANTPIYTPLNAEVHSFKNNTNYGDYGPTIILKHTINKITFYTLYGHLSLASIKDLKVNQVFKQGEPIATLGDSNVNGDYPPHLHFQIIRDLQNYEGDYPGVCSKKDLNFYTGNCPGPNTLLKYEGF